MINPNGESFVIAIPGQLSPDDAAELDAALQQLFARQPEAISLDCQDVDHLTSSHVKLLWQARTACADRGVTVRLSSAPEHVWKVLEVLDLAEFFIRDESSAAAGSRASPQELLGAQDVHEDHFMAIRDTIEEAQARFVTYMERAGLPVSTQYVLRTLFYEVATNVQLHAAKHGCPSIDFSAVADRSKIVMTFVDDGPPFDPTLFEDREESSADDADNRRSFGIAIMRRLADRMVYKRLDDRRNALILERNWRDTKWKKAPSRSAR